MSHEGLTPLEQIANDTIKLVIEIPKRDYEEIKKVGVFTFPRVSTAIREAIPLDKVTAEIESDGAYYQEIGEQERANAFLETLSIIDKCTSKK